MEREHNRILVMKYYQAITTQDWDLLEDILHEDLTHPLVNPKEEEYRKSPVNPWIEFLRLTKVDDSLVAKLKENYTEKKGFIKWTQNLAKVVDNFEIIDICVDLDKVWVFTSSSIKGPLNSTIYLSFFTRVWIRDGKIITFTSQGRFLETLLQFGQVIMKEDDKEGIANYLKSLQNMGLIPKEKVRD